MRTAFIHALCEAAAKDPTIWLLTGDLGYSVLEEFASRFPNRYVNIGVAEQNMTGIAAGLAMSGKKVFTYSIANFPTLRCLEQIRNDVCYHQCDVKIIAVGGGLSYASLGYTHHGVEDLAVMRVLPNMTVVAPGDPVEAKLATHAIAAHKGPCYMRLGKAGEPIIHKTEPIFELGKAIVMREGKDVAILSTGGMLQDSLAAADIIAKHGISAQVLSVHTITPLDETSIVTAAQKAGHILTVEEHTVGGLGDIVAETILRHGISAKFKSLRLDRKPITTAGSQNRLRAQFGLSPEGIAAAAQDLLHKTDCISIK